MATIITLDTLKNILKKFQGIIFNKYDNKIDTLDTDVNNRLGSLNSEIDTKLQNKVDKVSGKDLSTNDFTDEEKEKLASLSNYDDTELLEKINQIRPGYFTYIVKDNETLKNWAENVEGNDYSHILILGVELEYDGEVSNSSTQSIYALGGNKILCKCFSDFKNVYGVNKISNSATTCWGFDDCEYLTNCTFTNEWQKESGGYGYGFNSCDHLNNCTVYSNWVGYGFTICNYVNNCSYINHCEDACNFLDYGFFGCNYVRNCIYDVTQTTGNAFTACYSDNKKTPCSNTVEGGFNFSNNDEDIVSLKTDLTQEITDRKNADSSLETLIKNKVDKVDGKGLSTNDFTDADKTKLDGIVTGANKTIVDSALSATSTNPVQNKVVNSALGNKVDKNSRITIADSTDVTLSSFGSEPLSIGNSSGANLGIDTNEIQARNNGGPAPLYLNNGGGDVQIGTAGCISNNGMNYNGTAARATSDGEGRNIALTYSKLTLTSLWSGNSSVNAQTLTLSRPYTDFKFIIVEGCIYNEPNSQRMYAYIPSSQCSISVSTDGDEFLLAGSTADTNRRIRFGFPTTTTLYKIASDGTSNHKPIITNVWGLN